MCNCSSAAEGRVYIHRWTEQLQKSVSEESCTWPPAVHRRKHSLHRTSTPYLRGYSETWQTIPHYTTIGPAAFEGDAFLAGFIYEHSAAAVFPWWQKTYTPLILQFCIYSAAIMPSETVNTRTLLTCAWTVRQFLARRAKQKWDSITVQRKLSSQLSTLTQMPIEPVFSLWFQVQKTSVILFSLLLCAFL